MRGYWRYPEDGLHVVGTADVTLKCAECGVMREVLIRLSGETPDFIGEAIKEAGWRSADHTVLCSDRCYASLNEYHV